MTIIAKSTQTFFDIAMQYMGDVAFAIDIANVNGMGVTDDLIGGSVLILPDINLTNKQEKIVKEFKELNISPAGELPV